MQTHSINQFKNRHEKLLTQGVNISHRLPTPTATNLSTCDERKQVVNLQSVDLHVGEESVEQLRQENPNNDKTKSALRAKKFQSGNEN